MRLPFFNRPSTKNNTPVEDDLTEDPERQKARHRLIGAVFMVTVAVAGLPLIFDSRPKNHANDIAIQIIQPGAKDEKPADPKSVAPSEADKKAALEKEAKDSKDTKEVKKETLKEEAKSDKPAPVAKTLDKGEEVIAILEGRQDKKLAPSSPAANGSKYVIQIGAFSSEERVKNWQAKLKEQKVTTYVDIKTNKEGGKLHLLRSGPYADKASAEAAEKKIRYVGLSPKLIEQKAN
jgi:DedD protein